MRWGDETLVSRIAIDKLFKEGSVFRGRHLVLILRREDDGPRKVLFVASRRVGNAVQRSRAKRIMREAYRLLVPHLPSEPAHLAWIARASCARIGMHVVRDDMKRLLVQARFMRSGEETSTNT